MTSNQLNDTPLQDSTLDMPSHLIGTHPSASVDSEATFANEHETLLNIEIWIAGRDVEEALTRRRALERLMESRGVVRTGSGRLYYDLWCERTGNDPLAGQGDVIADGGFRCFTRDLSDLELEALTERIVDDLEPQLGFKVAAALTCTPAEGDVALERT